MTDAEYCRNPVDAAVEAGRLSAQAVHTLALGGYHVVMTPDGVKEIDLTDDCWRPYPQRITGTAIFDATTSLLDYWAIHADASSQLFADRDRHTITAVFDAHLGAGGDDTDPPTSPTAQRAMWQSHRAQLHLTQHPTLTDWLKYNEKPFDQAVFVEFLEDHASEVVVPDGATILQMVRDLRATSNAEFKAAYDPATGARTLGFHETIQTRVHEGEVDLPEQFTVQLPVWRGSEQTVQVDARLRIRTQPGRAGLTLHYKLHQYQDAIDAAFADEMAGVADKATRAVLSGRPM